MKKLKRNRRLLNYSGLIVLMGAYFYYIHVKGCDFITVLSYLALILLWSSFTKRLLG